MARTRRDDGGAVVVLVALTAPILLMIAGLSITRGIAADVQDQAQGAADVAARAAAREMLPGWRPGPASTTATEYVNADYGTSAADWPACTDPDAYDVHPGTVCVSFDLVHYRVRVVTPPREVPLVFGFLAGLPDGVPVRAEAEATWRNGQVALVE